MSEMTEAEFRKHLSGKIHKVIRSFRKENYHRWVKLDPIPAVIPECCWRAVRAIEYGDTSIPITYLSKQYDGIFEPIKSVQFSFICPCGREQSAIYDAFDVDEPEEKNTALDARISDE